LTGLFVLPAKSYADIPSEPITQAFHTNGVVHEVVRDGNILYIAGDFSEVEFNGGATYERTNLAAIDLTTGAEQVTSWSPDIDDTVNALVVTDSAIYIGGLFTEVDGEDRDYIVSFDKSTYTLTSWAPEIDSFASSPAVYTLEVDDDKLYVGGYFTDIDERPRYMAASFYLSNGGLTPWKPLFSKSVFTFAFDSSTIYVGGLFSGVGSQDRSRIASFQKSNGNLTSWNPVVQETDGTSVDVITIHDSYIYVGGSFNEISATERKAFARFDQSTKALDSWNPAFKLAFNDYHGAIYDIWFANDRMYVGGNFERVDTSSRIHAASFDLTTQSITPWNPGLNGVVEAFTGNSMQMFVGGWFTRRGVYRFTTGNNMAYLGYGGPGLAFFYDSLLVTPTLTPTATPPGPTATNTPTPTITPTPVPASDFQVDMMRREGDAFPGDGICDDGNGVCTMSGAVVDANNLAGKQTIDVPPGKHTVSSGLSDDIEIVGTGESPEETIITFPSALISGGVNITLSNVTLLESDFTINSSSDTVTLNNVVWIGGSNIKNGGTLIIEDSRFELNEGTNGGAVYSSGTLTIADSSFRSNKATYGGGLYIDGGTATLSDVIIEVNEARNEGGGIFCRNANVTIDNDTLIRGNINTYAGTVSTGGGISCMNSTVNIQDSIIKDNKTAEVTGYNIYGGGIYVSGGSLTLNQVLLESNKSKYGGGLYIDDLTDAIFITETTIRQNLATLDGGGVYMIPWYGFEGPGGGNYNINSSVIKGNRAQRYGGGVYVSAGVYSYDFNDVQNNIVNTTIGQNYAYVEGGGVYTEEQEGPLGFIRLYSATVSRNYPENIASYGEVVTKNTLVADPLQGGRNCYGPEASDSARLSSSGYNLSTDDTCNNAFTQTGDQTSVDPNLLPLTYNGGRTETYALQSGSPAVDAADPAGCTDPSTGSLLSADQRGSGYNRVMDGRCDIGAYEFDSASPSLTNSDTVIDTYLVNTTDDTIDANTADGVCEDIHGNCSLRAAVMEVNASANGYAIEVPSGVYVLDITGQNEDQALQGDLDIHTNTIIYGKSSSETIIDVNGGDRAFEVFTSDDVVIQNMTVRGANLCSGTLKKDDAGGIRASTGSQKLTLKLLKVIHNKGAVGGISKVSSGSGKLKILDSLVEANSYCGGGEGGEAENAHGGIMTDSDMTIEGTIVRGNTGGWGGGLSVGDGLNYTQGSYGPEYGAQVEISNSRFEFNDALYGGGGGVYVDGRSAIEMDTVTFHSNRASCLFDLNHCKTFSTFSTTWVGEPGYTPSGTETYYGGVPWGGGGLLAVNADVSGDGLTFVNNISGVGSHPESNHILGGGGAYGHWGGTSSIKNSDIIANISTLGGAGIMQGGFLKTARDAVMSLDNVKMISNHAVREGGAILATGYYGNFDLSWGNDVNDFYSELDIHNSHFSYNSGGTEQTSTNTGSGGGGIFIDNMYDTFVLSDSTISRNYSNGEKGGGIHLTTYDYSDFYLARNNIFANVIDSTSTFVGGTGGGLHVGTYAIHDAYAGIEFRIENTTFSDNIARYNRGSNPGYGAGIFAGGGTCVTQGTQNNQNSTKQQYAQNTRETWLSTISRFLRGQSVEQDCRGTTCDEPVGEVAGANTVVPATFAPTQDDCATSVEMYNVTIANNDPINIDLGDFALTNIKDSIITQQEGRSNCSGTTDQLVSLGHNTASDNTCDFYYETSQTGITATNAADMVDEDPALEPIRDNGGNSFTHALTATSSAIDTADGDGCSVTGTPDGITDQRGAGYDRYRDPVDPSASSPRCDRGAYEYAAEPTEVPTATPTPTPTSGPTPPTTPPTIPPPVSSFPNTPIPTLAPFPTTEVLLPTRVLTPTLPQPSSPEDPPTNTPAPTYTTGPTATPQPPTATPTPTKPAPLVNTGIPVTVAIVGGIYFLLSLGAIHLLFRQK
jgi:CSLREA domain-containing protein